jgi:hypothetical protein
MSQPHTSYFWSGTALRSRSVGSVVLSGRVDVPAPPARLVADWERDIASTLFLEPGDVEPLPLARARMRWPDYKHCVQAMADWTRALGLKDVLAASDIALMACRGARYHHDGEQYGSAAFCNLFVSEDKGLDVHFPSTGDRIALARGTVLMFDTAQPHAVIRRGSTASMRPTSRPTSTAASCSSHGSSPSRTPTWHAHCASTSTPTPRPHRN